MSRRYAPALVIPLALLVAFATVMTIAPGPSIILAQGFVEDFSDDFNPANPGFASSVFIHTFSGGGFELIAITPSAPSPPHALFLFSGRQDEITFPGQSVTLACAWGGGGIGVGSVKFVGTGGEKTFQLDAAQGWQPVQVTDTTIADNIQPLGTITKIVLVGDEFGFDNVQLNTPCIPTPPTSVAVGVIVKPPNINKNRFNSGLLKVVILTTPAFDATTVDPNSVKFGSADGADPGDLFSAFTGDEDNDGDDDLVMFFFATAVGITCGQTSIPLTAQTFGGQAVSGAATIKTIC